MTVRPVRAVSSADVAVRSVSTIDIQIPTRTGGTLAGSLDLPGDVAHLPPEEFRAARVPVAVLVHCFTCTRKAPATFRIAKALARAGFAALRFDLTGLGDSTGDFADTTFSSDLDDLRDAAAWAAQRLSAPQLLVGHSLGGAAVLAAAGDLPSLRAVATVGAPYRPADAAATLGDALPALLAATDDTPQAVALSGRDLAFRRSFLTDLAAQSEPAVLAERIGGLRVPLLVLHSPVDQTVAVAEAARLFAAAPWPKSMISLPEADHLLTWRGSAQHAGETIAWWARQYITALD
jgi:alpha-beta hydrolase superfamily lysophospholipase